MHRYVGSVGLVFLLLLGLCSNGSAATSSDSGDSDQDPSIYNLTDQNLSPSVRKCLAKNSFGKCLSEQLDRKDPVHVPKPEGDAATEQLDGEWADFLHSAIGASKAFSAYSPGFAFGFAYGFSRVDPEEVLMDPNMAATDKLLGSQDVWVVHTLELAPGMNVGTQVAPDDQPDTLSKSYYGGIFQAGGIVRLTKRHPLDQVYTQNLWGDLGQDKEVIKQSLPDYIRVPTELTGSGLLAGEGIQFEAFMLVEIGVGPTVDLGVTPTSPEIAAGVFGSAGFVATVMRGHFNTKMEVQQDKTLRVTLERINQDSEKLDAQVNAGFVLGPISFVENLLNLEVGVTHTTETLLDMVFDPTYPEAKHALKEAYFGRFKEAQELSQLSSQTYKGVREFAHSTAKDRMTDRDFSFLCLGKGSSETRSDIDTQFDNANDQTDLDEEDSHSSGFFGKSSDMQIAIRNDGDHPELGQQRSLSIKYNFRNNRPSQNDIQQFVDMAKIFGQSPVSPPKAKKPMQGYFFIDLDADNFKAIFTRTPSQLEDDFEAAAAQMPGAENHIKEIRAFANALAKAMQKQDIANQDHALISTLRGKNYDLYPIGVLSLLVDSAHSLALERVTFTTSVTDNSGSDLETVEFPAIGAQYAFPSQIEY